MPTVALEVVAHPVDLLDVGEDHLGVDPVLGDHRHHVIGGQEVGDAAQAPSVTFRVTDVTAIIFRLNVGPSSLSG